MKMFRVEFKVPSQHLGEVLATVHGKVEDLDVSLLEDVPHTKNVKRKTRKPVNGAGVNDVLLTAMKEAPDHSLTSQQARQLLMDAGFKADSYYGGKYALVKKGLVHVRNGKMTLVK